MCPPSSDILCWFEAYGVEFWVAGRLFGLAARMELQAYESGRDLRFGSEATSMHSLNGFFYYSTLFGSLGQHLISLDFHVA